MKLELIRHSLTQGNLEKRYVGATDQELCPQGVALAEEHRRKEPVGTVYASPMLRCIQTARLLFPQSRVETVPGLEETRFGKFEYHSYRELEKDPDYQKWIESGGCWKIPGGEGREEFAARCSAAFVPLADRLLAEGCRELPLVVHGGVIMALCQAHGLPQRDFYHYQSPCCQGWQGEVEPELWQRERRFRIWQEKEE